MVARAGDELATEGWDSQSDLELRFAVVSNRERPLLVGEGSLSGHLGDALGHVLFVSLSNGLCIQPGVEVSLEIAMGLWHFHNEILAGALLGIELRLVCQVQEGSTVTPILR